MVENKNATQKSPPVMRWASSRVGSKAKLKITTTRSAKNSMELNTSRERHSRRMSLARFASVSWVMEGTGVGEGEAAAGVTASPAAPRGGPPTARRKETETHRRFPPAGQADGWSEE